MIYGYGKPAGERQDTTGRFETQPNWPMGGMVSRPMGDRRYEVQMFTGYSVSTVPAGGWARSQIIRGSAIPLRPAKPPIMYDPTDPRTWPYPHF